MTNTQPTTTPTTPPVWYDYVLQCWIVNGYVKPCGHPASMKPTCCYAGSHAGEAANPAHFQE